MSVAFSDHFFIPCTLGALWDLYLQSQICLDRRILLCLRLFFANGRLVVAVVFFRTLAEVSCRVLFASEGPASHVNGYLVLSHHVKRLIKSPCVTALFFQISRLWLAMSSTVLWSDQDHAETFEVVEIFVEEVEGVEIAEESC